MNVHQKKIVNAFIIFLLISAVPLGVFLFPKYLVHVENFAQKISVYTSHESNVLQKPLPFSQNLRLPRAQTVIEGEFTILRSETDGIRYIFIPFYVGHLRLSLGGEIFYDSNVSLGGRPITSVSNVIARVPEAADRYVLDDGDGVRIRFQLERDRTGLASLGNVYIGSHGDFQTPMLKNIVYYDVFRVSMLGVQIAFLSILIIVFFAHSLSSEYIAPIILLSYFVLLGIGGLSSEIPDLLILSQIGIALSPVAALSIGKLFLDTFNGKLHDRSMWVFSMLVSIFVIPLLLIYFGLIDIVTYNLFVPAPALFLCLVAITLSSAVIFIKSRRSSVGLWAVASTLMASSILHDIFARLGLLDTTVFTTALASPVFVVILSGMFFKVILSTRSKLLEVNAFLQNSLEDQSRQLSAEFEKSAELLKEATIAAEKARLTTELHDGVLTYLGMMTVLSERFSDPTLLEINKLSRYASNEIRVILEARPSDQDSLTIALGALRAQMIDPLRHLGVEVEWSTQALLDYGTMKPKALMNTIRIIQEAIHNAVFRSRCTHLSIRGERQDNEFKVIITNKGGRAFSDKNRKGLGIVNMTDRASIIGGKVTITRNESGAILVLDMPRVEPRNGVGGFPIEQPRVS